MGIFDGYENKSPEEVADELGISDLSVVGNTEHEILGNLEQENSDEKIEINSEGGYWVGSNKIHKLFGLEKGMIIRNKDGEEGEIISTNFNGEIMISGFGLGTVFCENSLPTSFKIFIEEDCANLLDSDGRWVVIRNINQLEPKMKIKSGMEIKVSSKTSSDEIIIVDMRKGEFHIKSTTGGGSIKSMNINNMPYPLYVFVDKKRDYYNQAERKEDFNFLDFGLEIEKLEEIEKRTNKKVFVRIRSKEDKELFGCFDGLDWEDETINVTWCNIKLNEWTATCENYKNLIVDASIRIKKIEDLEKGMSLMKKGSKDTFEITGFAGKVIFIKNKQTDESISIKWEEFTSEWKAIINF